MRMGQRMKIEELFSRMLSGEQVWFWKDDNACSGQVCGIRKHYGEIPQVSVSRDKYEYALLDRYHGTQEECRIARAAEILEKCDKEYEIICRDGDMVVSGEQ